MLSWSAFAAGAPELAAAGRELLFERGAGKVLLATVRGADEPPRLHPISVAVRDDRLLMFIGPSPKLTDLRLDGRFALHGHHDPAHPNEFAIRGRAVLLDDPDERARYAADWPFEPDETFVLFELLLATAVHGRRNDPSDWPPAYSTWSATTGG